MLDYALCLAADDGVEIVSAWIERVTNRDLVGILVTHYSSTFLRAVVLLAAPGPCPELGLGPSGHARAGIMGAFAARSAEAPRLDGDRRLLAVQAMLASRLLCLVELPFESWCHLGPVSGLNDLLRDRNDLHGRLTRKASR